MLHKLLKYNLRAIYRQLAIFYIIAITCAIIGRGFNNHGDNLLFKIIHEFFSGAAIGLCFGIIINNATRIWEYTKRDFYGDQSYLTHTLPIPRSTLYLAKFCTIIITVFSSLLIIATIVFINYASPETFAYIQQLINDCGSTSEFVKFTALILSVLFLETIFITQIGITGIVLGHKSNNHKSLKSFAYGFALFIICNIVTVTVINLWRVFDPEISRFIYNGYSTNSIMEKILCGVICAYLVYIAATFYLGQRSLEKGIDVE